MKMWFIFAVVVATVSVVSGFRSLPAFRQHSFATVSLTRSYAKSKPPKKGTSPVPVSVDTTSVKLLPLPPLDSVGTFFASGTNETAFVHCNMLAVARVRGTEYGIGYPIDVPAVLGYFDDTLKDLVIVEPKTFPDYNELVEHIQDELDEDDLLLIPTPIGLTVHGDFEDDELNDPLGFHEDSDNDSQDDSSYETTEPHEPESVEGTEVSEGSEESDENSLTMAQIMEQVDKQMEAEGPEYLTMYDEDEDDDEEAGEGDADDTDADDFDGPFEENEHGQIIEDNEDYTLIRPTSGGDVDSEEAVADDVSEEDVTAMRKAHRRADLIFDEVGDMGLMGTFYFKKRAYHLLRLVDPEVLFAEKRKNLRGHYYTLLDGPTSDKLRPEIEQLLNDEYSDRLRERLAIEEVMAREHDAKVNPVKKRSTGGTLNDAFKNFVTKGGAKGTFQSDNGGNDDGNANKLNRRTAAEEFFEPLNEPEFVPPAGMRASRGWLRRNANNNNSNDNNNDKNNEPQRKRRV